MRYILFNQLKFYLCRAQLKQWMRSCTLYRYFRNYFPVKLVKTTDLDPNKSYLFCNFPHGIICFGVYGAFGTDFGGFKKLFPGIEVNVIILEQFFKIPFFREYLRVSCKYNSSILLHSSLERIYSY